MDDTCLTQCRIIILHIFQGLLTPAVYSLKKRDNLLLIIKVICNNLRFNQIRFFFLVISF